MRARVGTSGWSYRHWRGVFYPPNLSAGEWLRFYAARFDTVELNATFYRLPPPERFERWSTTVPAGFRFAVKVSRYLTHVRRLRDPEDAAGLLRERCRLLGERAGPYLLQLPPRFPPEPGQLARVLRALDGQVAVEPRDERWFVPEVRRVLEDHGAALVWSDHPAAPSPEWTTAEWWYLRRHGVGETYGGRYGRRRLASLAERIAGLGGEVWCFFNNDARGAAVADAAELRRLLGESAS